MKKLSIIVPVYNVEKYLDKCLKSLVNQTIKNYEIIIVIDGSKDNSIDIVKRYKKKFPNLIRYYQTENNGLSEARNYGLSKARGEFVGFVDSDDYINKNMYKDLYDCAILGNYDIVACNYARVTNKGKKNIILDISNDDELKEKVIKSRPYAWNKLYKKNLFDKYNLKFPKGIIFEDIYTIYSLLISSKNIGYVDKVLYYYNVNRTDSIMKSRNRKDSDVLIVLSLLNNFFRKNGNFNEVYDILCDINVRHIFYRLREMKNYNRKVDNRIFLKDSFHFLDTNFKNWKTDSEYARGIKNYKKRRINWVIRIMLWRK